MKINNLLKATVLSIIVLTSSNGFSQTTEQTVYPKPVGYLSFILPVVTFANKTTNDFTGFSKDFSIGFPVGVNVLYSETFGFSFEVVPHIKTANNSSKVNNLTIDPGPMFRFSHGFTFIPRLGFETTGRYGFTPVFNQIIARTKFLNYFIALSAPFRFGDNAAPSTGISFQVGFIFK
jgi:hypothetical protein